jgi:hypothetical protein
MATAQTREAARGGPAPAGAGAASRRLPLRQLIKIAVYGLLLVNFGFYLVDDWTVASHTARDSWTLLDWSRAFATTLDEAAWFVLLFLFELETYLLDDDAFTRRRLAIMHWVRIVCMLFIGHTVYAFGHAVFTLFEVEPAAASGLCDFATDGIAYAFNLTYTPVNADSCPGLARDSTFYLLEQGTLVTDASGLQVERELAVVDLVEVVAWIVILLLIEFTVRQQDRGITDSRALRGARSVKFCLYGVLWLCAAYWLYRGHWVFAWDEALWILGFIAIDMNIEEWREELEEGPATGTGSG